ncbi:MAG TPA: dipeptidase [Candidatus Acidoferrales bacterium]|nr:dipeptidase [Candidatus Acidoferrales bacterium]
MISEKTRDLHFRSLVCDTHQDTTQRLLSPGFDLAARHGDGAVDIPRLREGGVGAAFWAVFVPGTITGAAAVEKALAQIRAAHEHVSRHPNDLVLCRTAAEIRSARALGRIAILLAVEGGHMIHSDLDVLRSFYSLGVRYLTLTHMRNTEWADSSTDAPAHNGLTYFGRRAIREMNRLGMMVDVSHASDQTFRDALAVSRAPLIASHSSCRALCGSPRNLTDDMMRSLAAAGGVVQINFHVGFLSQGFWAAEDPRAEIGREIAAEVKGRAAADESRKFIEWERVLREFVAVGKLPRVEWTEIIEHIVHAVRVVGADHVGIGSDFDGAYMPYGMEDASCLPRITDALCERGYSEADIQKILGANTLRLMEQVEAAAET